MYFPIAKKANNFKTFQAMTTDLASFPKKYLETFWSRVDVYVNIDVAAGNQVLTAMFFLIGFFP